MMALEFSIVNEDNSILQIVLERDVFPNASCSRCHRDCYYNHFRSESWTPLHHAARMCHYESVRSLLDHGAEVDEIMQDEESNSVENIYGVFETSLHITCGLVAQLNSEITQFQDIYRLANLLLERGANPNLSRKHIVPIENASKKEEYVTIEETAIHIAMEHGSIELVELLLQHGASLDIPWIFGEERISCDTLAPEFMVLWKPQFHRLFPASVRKIILTILLCAQRQQWNIPKDVMYELLRYSICGGEKWTLHQHLEQQGKVKPCFVPLEGSELTRYRHK